MVGTVNLGMPSFLDRVSKGHANNSGGHLLIAPQHKLFVTASDKQLVMQSLPAQGVDSLFDKLVQGDVAFGISKNLKGDKLLMAAMRIPLSGWVFATTVSTEEASEPIRKVENQMLLVGTLLTFVAGLIAWFVTFGMLKRQLAPILSTTKQLKMLSQTEQPLKLAPLDPQDEIGEMIASMNLLVDSLARREDALKTSGTATRQALESAQIHLDRLSRRARGILRNLRRHHRQKRA
ncbi:MAG: hypothetical protein K9K38_04225 [Rhodoferax sp.]|nr:hypothetical protein [Rhodoferax sp.]MCF8208600.1 hypothetical protein [Rhodoferax sp.]